MRKLILPGDMRANTGMSILVPKGYETGAQGEPTMVCRVPVGPGEACGAPFWPGQEGDFERHVQRCRVQHEEEIHNNSPRARMPIFDEASWDPEIAAHMREVGRRMLKEGRFVVHKHERAGF
jgi:hypothetical protein